MFRSRGSGTVAMPANVYQMRERLFSIGEDFWIENGRGQRVFKVDGKALRIRKTLVLEAPDGRELYRIEEKLLTIKNTMEIEGPGGRAATVKKRLFTPLRQRYDVELARGGEWAVQGNILDHHYEITSGRTKVAEVGKKWARVRETYGIEIEPGQDDALVTTVVIAIDQMAR